MQHLNMNVKAKFKGVKVSALLISAAKTYSETDFHHLMNQIYRISVPVYNYITAEAKVHQWSRLFFPGRRYSIMTTNIAESMNVVLRDAREYPIVSLLEAILNKLVLWLQKR